MININSTEEERYQELKDRHLTVVPWREDIALQMTDPDESIAKALKRQAKELGLIGTYVNLEGIKENVQINMPTIKESIASMTKQHADLYNLSKLFTCFHEALENSVLIQVEEYRHKSQDQRAKEIVGEYQYISAFYDAEKVYPVKITAEQRKSYKETNVHVTVTIGDFDLDRIKKEEHSILRVHPSNYGGESSDSGRYSSFNINVPQFVKLFNENQAILIKNLPDKMLDDAQVNIKQKLINFDREKDISRRLALYVNQMTEAAERGENFAYKVIPHEYGEKMKQAMLKTNICFVEYPSEINGELFRTIAVQEKDTEAFLKVQEQVFNIPTPVKEKCMGNPVKDSISNTVSEEADDSYGR